MICNEIYQIKLVDAITGTNTGKSAGNVSQNLRHLAQGLKKI